MPEKSALNTGATPQYADAMMSFLGEREPMEVFVATPGDLRKAVAGLTKQQLMVHNNSLTLC